MTQSLSNRDAGRWIETAGVVCRLLSDDDERHQRFVINTGGGSTLLVAHNLEIAERVPVALGDRVRCRGVYEHNDLGGTVHWTHRDPMGRDGGGWIEHRRQRYS